MTGYRVAVVGATGAVGREVLDILGARRFPAAWVRALASPRSAGVRIGEVVVQPVNAAAFDDIDIAIFDTPDDVAETWVPVAAGRGAVVIDNSAAFRMAPDVPLVIPEVNPEALRRAPRRIIANPNCTTATVAVPLAPLHRAAGLRRVIACSYQSVSGAGHAGVTQLWAEIREAVGTGAAPARPQGTAFRQPIALNVIPAVGSFRGGRTSEEIKMEAELRKMLGAPDVAVGVTCVRVPTLRAHGVAVHAEFFGSLGPERAREILASAPGVHVVDDPTEGRYPTALAASGCDPCHVGRIRADGAGMLAFFTVADNLRKGAALNAVQIAEAVVRDGALLEARTA
ncbi:MAG TPA: aspartate-semialdehyde dehydrogenase [bacterium]|nr:aspartate-semialdehyde dehydrogenase [bacterium]